jgi:hypothetical protein
MLVASVSTDRLLCCQPDLTNLLQMADPSRWQTRHVVYRIPLWDKRSYAMPNQDIPCQIYQIPTYTGSYTLTCIDIKSCLINLIIVVITRLLHSTFFFPPTTCLLPRTEISLAIVGDGNLLLYHDHPDRCNDIFLGISITIK